MRARWLLALCLVPSLASAQSLVEVPVPNMGGTCDDMDTGPLADAIDREIAILSRKSPSERWVVGAFNVGVAEYAQKTLAPLAALARQGAPALCAGLAKRFRFFRNSDAGAGRFSAYHNPVIQASRRKQGPYQHAIYRRPPGDLAKLTTQQIIAGGLNGKGLELLYVADASALPDVHVEGSATVMLDDGTMISLGSDGNNGQEFVKVSEIIAREKKIPKTQVTPLGMSKHRKYFMDHPDELWVYWAKNPRYIFFKEKDASKIGGGKFGELTAGRSLAIDPAHFPQGAAAWIRTDKPAIAGNKVAAWISFGRVALGQDSGARIKGPARVDVFFGTGEYAQQASQVTDRPGELYVLLAK